MVSSIYKLLSLVHYEFMKNIDTLVIYPSVTDPTFEYPAAIDSSVLETAVMDSFQVSDNGDGFIAKSKDYAYSNPVNRIAAVALGRLGPNAKLEFSKELDREELRAIGLNTSYPGRAAHVSQLQANQLSVIGRAELKLDEAGFIKPPLGRIEKLSIIRLIDLVDVTAICA